MNAPVAEQLDVVRGEVHRLLDRSDAFASLPTDKRQELANHLVKVSS